MLTHTMLEYLQNRDLLFYGIFVLVSPPQILCLFIFVNQIL